MNKAVVDLAKYAKDIRILLVEDDDEVLLATGSLLSAFFETVDIAVNGQDGLDKYRHGNHDIVLSDIKMPVMDGLEMVKEIKKIREEQVIFVISAYDSVDYLVEFLNAGIDSFILKPLDNQKLIRLLLKACKSISNERTLLKYITNINAIFSSINEAIVTVDEDLVIIEFNKAAMDICDFEDGARGEKLESYLNESSKKCLDVLKETFKLRLPVESNRFEWKKHGKPIRIIQMTAYPLFDHLGKFCGSVMIFRDNTELANLEKTMHERQGLHNVIGSSEEMQKVYAFIDALADVQTTVLITGESGTGKELVAEALHYYKRESKNPFVKVNCAAMSENLLESELFGHVKGAFTGAVSDRIGRFQKADGGTIFLDEIGDISNNMQLLLLRVLQEQEFERVGDSTTIKVNVRIIAATNQDLLEKIKQGTFREDLYHRLKVIELRVPPLREKREDIPLLIKYFINKLNKKLDKDIEHVTDDVLRLFAEYNWPGNIRELLHVIEHAVVMSKGPIITVEDLSEDFQYFRTTTAHSSESKKHNNRQSILLALEESGWNKAKAARTIGMSRTHFYLKMKEYNIVENRQ